MEIFKLTQIALIITLTIIGITYFYLIKKYIKNKKKLEQIEKHIPTILIVEDDPDNVTLLSMILHKICNVKVVTNGEDAVALCENEQFQVILMDINLGSGLDGIETTNKIRKINGYDKSYIVALTYYTPKDIVAEFKDFSYFIAKPYNKEYIRELVKGLLLKK